MWLAHVKPKQGKKTLGGKKWKSQAVKRMRHQHERRKLLQKAVKQQHDDVDMGRLSKAG